MSATVRCRIAVAVGDTGALSASGWRLPGEPLGKHDKDAADVALEMLDSDADLHRVVYVEADIPLPEPPDSPTVAGEVVE